MALLDEVGKSPAPTEELKALRDKANVALGFAALADEKPEAARAYLERVRLSSMLSNKALLGFGWASAALKQPKQALVPWSELTGSRDASDAAVLEARIAVAFAYAELGAYGQSLERYQDAIGAFDRENVALDESIARDPRRQAARRPAREEPGRRDGLVLEHPGAARAAARGSPDPGVGAPRVPGSLQELARPALPDQEPAGLGRRAERLQGHARQSPASLRRAAAEGARAGERRDSWASRR